MKTALKGNDWFTCKFPGHQHSFVPFNSGLWKIWDFIVRETKINGHTLCY